jgi:hypothetical protein
MKTNFYTKSFLIIVASASILAACSNQSDPDRKTSSSSQPSTENTSSQMSRMPDSILHWYAPTVANCKAGNRIGIKIREAKLIKFGKNGEDVKRSQIVINCDKLIKADAK